METTAPDNPIEARAPVQLSPQQQDAVERVLCWLAAGPGKGDVPPVFRLFGYAGTGKTTLARELANHVDGEVLFAAFTGKAAHVLTSKGCPAQTVHSLIYYPCGEDKATGAAQFALNHGSELLGASLLVLDECSMIDAGMGRDLLSFGCPVLVLGDPGQLPPISGAGFFTEGEPDVLLTEIHRQAKGDPIIHLATMAREGKPLPPNTWHGESYVGPPRAAPPDRFLTAADQILCGRNVTRTRLNRRVRELLGRASLLPEPGDRLVCLRNQRKLGLLNGSIWTVLDARPPRRADAATLRATIESVDTGARVTDVRMHLDNFSGTAPQQKRYSERSGAEEFDFGYALTTHKAQGSQWDDVLLYDESYCFREHAHRWLYTGITRAARRVMIAKV